MTDLLPVSGLDEPERELVEKAIAVRRMAYAPYSNFFVGCALRDALGKCTSAAMWEERVVFSDHLCERVALFAMVTTGQRDCTSLVVITSAKKPCFPCGMCLQVIGELAAHASIIAVDDCGKYYRRTTVRELSPYSFLLDEIEK